MNSQKWVAGGVAVISAAIIGWAYLPGLNGSPGENAAEAAKELVVPEFSELALQGKASFEASCAVCHGVNATGTDQGPSLIDLIYRPRVHSDAAIRLAPRVGVRAHHWRFGSMPSLREDVPDAEMDGIIRFIRELQEANGIK